MRNIDILKVKFLKKCCEDENWLLKKFGTVSQISPQWKYSSLWNSKLKS